MSYTKSVLVSLILMIGFLPNITDAQPFNENYRGKSDAKTDDLSYTECENVSSADMQRKCDNAYKAAKIEANSHLRDNDPERQYDTDDYAQIENQNENINELSVRQANEKNVPINSGIAIAATLSYAAQVCTGTLGAGCAAAGFLAALQVKQHVQANDTSQEIVDQVAYDLPPVGRPPQYDIPDIDPALHNLQPNEFVQPNSIHRRPDIPPVSLPSGTTHSSNINNNSDLPEYLNQYITHSGLQAEKDIKKYQAQGFQYNPQKGDLTLPNGKHIKASELFTEKGASQLGLTPQQTKAFLAQHKKAVKISQKAGEEMRDKLTKDIAAIKKHHSQFARKNSLSGTHKANVALYKDNFSMADWHKLLRQLQQLKGSSEKKTDKMNKVFSDEEMSVLGRAEDNIFEMIHRRYMAKRSELLSGDSETANKRVQPIQPQQRNIASHSYRGRNVQKTSRWYIEYVPPKH